jgi:hypothetical protein
MAHVVQEFSKNILNVSYKITLDHTLKPNGLNSVSLQRATSDVM